MRLRLDPWPADYEAPIQFEDLSDNARVDLTVESPDWRAIFSADAEEPVCCCFVDGVRRVEARVLADTDAGLVHGLFGSAATGFVRTSNRHAEFGGIEVSRFLIFGRQVHREARLHIGSTELHFQAHSSIDNSPKGALAELQRRMRAAEERLVSSLCGREGCCFVDGLSYRITGHQEVIGVVKTIMEPYLPPEQFALIGTLKPKERTPLFAILSENYTRYSCFLRLTTPREVDHPLSGIVRLELGTAMGIDRAIALVSSAASMLPRFASSPIRDPRAPQNLLPVGALEQEMKRRLGDPLMIRRAIEKELHEHRDW